MNEVICTFVASDLSKFSFGYDEESAKCLALKAQIAQYINDVYKGGVREFYTVCEQGPELWAAQIIVTIMQNDPTVKLHCLIPYEEQAAKWHNDTRELYYHVLEEATADIKFLNTHYKEGCVEDARRQALDCADMVFAAVVDGEENELVKYSRACGKKVFVEDRT